MARVKRKTNRGRAIRLLLLAGLTLLIAGFIARREIPSLIERTARSPAGADADYGGQGASPANQTDPHPSAGHREYAGNRTRQAPDAASKAGGDQENQSGEHITGSDRRQLDKLIEQKSR